MNLYDLKQELVIVEKKLENWAMENEGDATEFPLIEALCDLELNIEEKALSIGVWIKNLLAESNAIKEEKKALDAREKAGKNKADRLKAFLQDIVPSGSKYSNTQCVIGWRKSESVLVTAEPHDVPEEYQKVKIEVDKKLLKEELKKGGVFTFATLEKKNNIQIK